MSNKLSASLIVLVSQTGASTVPTRFSGMASPNTVQVASATRVRSEFKNPLIPDPRESSISSLQRPRRAHPTPHTLRRYHDAGSFTHQLPQPQDSPVLREMIERFRYNESQLRHSRLPKTEFAAAHQTLSPVTPEKLTADFSLSETESPALHSKTPRRWLFKNPLIPDTPASEVRQTTRSPIVKYAVVTRFDPSIHKLRPTEPVTRSSPPTPAAQPHGSPVLSESRDSGLQRNYKI